jgi:hypothetical protein
MGYGIMGLLFWLIKFILLITLELLVGMGLIYFNIMLIILSTLADSNFLAIISNWAN